MTHPPKHLHHCLAALFAFTLAGCSTYSSVKLQRPKYQPNTTNGALIAKAFSHDQREPLVAIGEYLEAVRLAEAELHKNPQDAGARHDYSFALGRIIQTLSEAKLDPWSKPLRVPAPGGGEYTLAHKLDSRPEWNPALYEFTPADQFDVGGTYVTERKLKDGIGAPLVAVGRTQKKNASEEFALPKVYYGITALAKFDGVRRCEIFFADPLATETIKINGHSYPLAADFTVPIAVMLAQAEPKKMELARLLNPQKYAETARIARLQPYDPSKTVILCVHGLMDSPATWAPLINSLRADPEIRQHYQFWFYSYPSGYPYPHSAAILREQLDAVEKRFPLQHKMVLIGHSMGGMISRLMLTDSGDKLWRGVFGDASPEKVQISENSRKLFTEALIFKHRPEVGRVIFIAAPHRGSDLASNWLGRLGSKLVRSPVTLLKAGTEMASQLVSDPTSLGIKRIPNSVDTLSPNNRFVKAVNTISPTDAGIPFHSIIGDRGKGGNKDHTKPISSDGFVPYWSSHLDGAQSELLVPSGHSAHQNPQAIEEVRRILLLHLKKS